MSEKIVVVRNGPAGPAGPAGPEGPVGPPGESATDAVDLDLAPPLTDEDNLVVYVGGADPHRTTMKQMLDYFQGLEKDSPLQVTPPSLPLVQQGDSVRLLFATTQEPLADVVITLSPPAGVVCDVTELTFTSDNWQLGQPVNVSSTHQGLLAMELITSLPWSVETLDFNYNLPPQETPVTVTPIVLNEPLLFPHPSATSADDFTGAPDGPGVDGRVPSVVASWGPWSQTDDDWSLVSGVLVNDRVWLSSARGPTFPTGPISSGGVLHVVYDCQVQPGTRVDYWIGTVAGTGVGKLKGSFWHEMSDAFASARDPYPVTAGGGIGTRITDSVITGAPVPAPPASGEYHHYIEFEAGTGGRWRYWGGTASPLQGETIDVTGSEQGPWSDFGNATTVLMGFNSVAPHGIKKIQWVPGLSFTDFYG